MPINFDAALGIHAQALATHSRRAEVLANNIANADTPGYQARDMDFKQVLAGARNDQMNMNTTHRGHISGNASGLTSSAELLYRTPSQPSLDGNTVDLQIEQAEYAKNAMRFQSSFTFLNGKFGGLRSAIRGE